MCIVEWSNCFFYGKSDIVSVLCAVCAWVYGERQREEGERCVYAFA